MEVNAQEVLNAPSNTKSFRRGRLQSQGQLQQTHIYIYLPHAHHWLLEDCVHGRIQIQI